MLKKQNWKYHWLTRWDEIWDPGFVRQWQFWMDQSPSAHVFFHPALVKAWVDTYLSLRDLRPFFLVAELAEYTLFFPLILWRRNWKNAFQKLLIPAGYSDYDYHDPIIADVNSENLPDMNSFWNDFINMLGDKSSPVKFDLLALDGIRQSLAGQETNNWRCQDACPWIDLRPFKRPEDFLPSLKMNLRKDLRRQHRRINETGELSHLIFSDDMEKEALKELTPFLDSHTLHWPQAYKAPHFHENIIRQSLKAGILHFSALRIGDESAAWVLSFVFQKHFYGYLLSHDDKFSAFSPGKVIFLKCIEDAIRRKLSIFDCLRGEESFKAGWTDKAELLWSLRLDGKYLMPKVRNMLIYTMKAKRSKLP